MIKKIQVKDQSGNITGTYDVGQVAPEVAEKIDNLLNEETGNIQYTTKTNGVDVTLRGSNNVDLRCEDHGGIALQPKGFDGNTQSTSTIDTVMSNSHEIGSDEAFSYYNIDVSRCLFDSNKTYVLKYSVTNSATVLTRMLFDGSNIYEYYEISLGGSNGLYFTFTSELLEVLATGNVLSIKVGVLNQEVGSDDSIQLCERRVVQNGMNKIKFEHGGGDGLEFGTFNTEKTSIYTQEYRFKKDGIIRLATRLIADNSQGGNGNGKYDGSDETTHYSYVKQADDFYDIVSNNDPTCTWEDIITFVDWAKTNNYGPWAV